MWLVFGVSVALLRSIVLVSESGFDVRVRYGGAVVREENVLHSDSHNQEVIRSAERLCGEYVYLIPLS